MNFCGNFSASSFCSVLNELDCEHAEDFLFYCGRRVSVCSLGRDFTNRNPLLKRTDKLLIINFFGVAKVVFIFGY